MRYLMLWINCFALQVCHSQYVYVSSSQDEIYRLDLSDGCTQTIFPNCAQGNAIIQDIAIDAFGKLYVCRNDSIFLIDTNNPSAGCNFITALSPYTTSSIEIGPDGKLYMADKNLVRYNFVNNSFENLGELPATMIASGDLVFYVNRLYMTSASGSIYEIDINNPSSSKPFYNPGIANLTGFVISPAKCFQGTSDELRLFAFEDLGNNRSAVHIIDMEKKLTYYNFCQKNIQITGNTGFHPPTVVTDNLNAMTVTVSSSTCSQTADGSIEVSATGNGIYSFLLNDAEENSTGIFKNLSSGDYKLTVRDKMGCSRDTTIKISARIHECADSIYIPAAFTPNGDGKNDIFRAKSFIPYPDFKMQLFDRNGQQVFNAGAITDGWDGRIKGTIQTTNSYIWLITYTNLSGKKIYRRGLVTLIR